MATRLWALLRNMASAGEGAVADSSGDFSADYPAAGAFNGDATHLNWGPAATAENLKGKAGWKSSTNENTGTISTAAEFTGGTQADVIDVGDAVQIAMTTSRYEQDFDDLNAGVNLATQDSWVAVSGIAFITVEIAAAYGGSGKGVQLTTGFNAVQRTDEREVTFGDTVATGFRLQHVIEGNAADYMTFAFMDDAVVLYEIRVYNDRTVHINDGGVIVPVDTKASIDFETWHQFWVEMERSVPGTTTAKLLLDGKQIDEREIDTTGLDRHYLRVSNLVGGVTAETRFYLDEIRTGDHMEDDGTQINVFDWATAPSSPEALLEFNGETERVERFIDVWPLAANDTSVALRDAAARTELAQLITPPAEQIDRAIIELSKVAAPTGNVWLEIRNVDGGDPGTDVYARSASRLAEELTSVHLPVTFSFVFPFTPDGASQYALVLVGDFAIDGANYVIWRSDVSAPGYAGGTAATWNGAAWTIVAAQDHGFALLAFHQSETEYDSANQDTDELLGRDADNHYLAQSFQVPYDVWARHAQVWMKVPAGVSFDASDRFWAELQTGLGTDLEDIIVDDAWEEQEIITKVGASDPVTGCFSSLLAQDTAFPDETGFWDPMYDYVNNTFACQTISPSSNVEITTATLRLLLTSGIDDAPKWPNGATKFPTYADWERGLGVDLYVEIYAASQQQLGSLAGTYPLPTGSRIGLSDKVEVNIEGVLAGNVTFTFSTPVALTASAEYVVRLVGVGRPYIENLRYVYWGGYWQNSRLYPYAGAEPYHWAASPTRFSTQRMSFRLAPGWQNTRQLKLYGDVDIIQVMETPKSFVDNEPHTDMTPVLYLPGLVSAAGGDYRWVTVSLPSRYLLKAGVTYYLFLRHNWTGAADKFLHVGSDRSSPSYAEGSLFYSDDSAPVVWSTRAADMCFRLLGEDKPFIRWSAAYSDDDDVADPYVDEVVQDNPDREGSIAETIWTGESKRYWRMTGQVVRKTTLGPDYIWGPVLLDYTLTLPSGGEAWLASDFSQTADETRVITGVEIYAHPYEGGVITCRIEGKTTDAGAWTLLDDIVESGLIARKHGGGAAIASEDGVIQTSGDYLFIPFEADHDLTDVRVVVVKGPDDGFARVIEFRAFQIVDMSERIASLTLQASSDPLGRTPKSRTLSLELINTDHYLSIFRTESGYSDQLGDSTRFIVWKHFEGTEHLMLGAFHVATKWFESPGQGVVTVKARDVIDLLQRDVQARLKTGLHHYQIIEYLANLGGVPSQDMKIDRTSGVVDFFAPKEAPAWSEIKLVSQAAGHGESQIDEHDYLEFRATGHTGRNTRLEEVTDIGTVIRSQGPTFLGGNYYWLVYTQNVADTTKEDLKLAVYSLEDASWTVAGVITESMSAGRGGLITSYGDAVFFFNFATGSGSASHTADMYVLEASGAITRVAEVNFGSDPYTIPGQGNIRNDWTIFQDDHLMRVCLGDADTDELHGIHDVNLLTYEVTLRSPPAGATRLLAVVKEAGVGAYAGAAAWIAITKAADVLKFQSWVPISNAYSDKGTLAATADTAIALVGLTATAKGYVYALSIGDGTPVNAGVYDKLTVPGFTHTTTDALANVEIVVPYHTGNALVYADNVAFGVISTAGGAGGVDSFLLHDEALGATIQHAAGNVVGSRLGYFKAGRDNENYFIMGTLDDARVFEFLVKKTITRTAQPALILNNDEGGLLLNASLEANASSPEGSHIVNSIIVRSLPLGTHPLIQVWEGSDLPWALVLNKTIQFQMEMEEPCFPADTPTLDIVYAGGGAANVTFEQLGLQRGRITVETTTAGRIVAIFLRRQPLKPIRKIISTTVGTGRSTNRYNVRTIPFDNPYVYDPVNGSILAASILSRLEANHVRLKGVEVWSAWTLRRFDRVRVTDERMGLDAADFYVTDYTYNDKTTKTPIKLIKVSPLT